MMTQGGCELFVNSIRYVDVDMIGYVSMQLRCRHILAPSQLEESLTMTNCDRPCDSKPEFSQQQQQHVHDCNILV